MEALIQRGQGRNSVVFTSSSVSSPTDVSTEMVSGSPLVRDAQRCSGRRGCVCLSGVVPGQTDTAPSRRPSACESLLIRDPPTH